MPELPDVLLYVSALKRTIQGQTLRAAIVRSPAVLKTYSPDLAELQSKTIVDISRCGKRIVWHFEGNYFLVFHLMIAGRFHCRKPSFIPRGKNDLAAFRFDEISLALTEASQQKRAGLWCFVDQSEVDQLDRGGIDILSATNDQLIQKLLESNNTLKRALTDPRRFDGVGNAYSDEILHAARLSPLKRTFQLSGSEQHRLCDAMKVTLQMWIDRLQNQYTHRFPEKVTAFRPEMIVHGKFKEPCATCGVAVQRIRYASNECNYCPACQTEGRILADRSLSRLLKDDWPKSIDELE